MSKSLWDAASREAIAALSDEEFRQIVEWCDDECIDRGWPCTPFEEPR